MSEDWTKVATEDEIPEDGTLLVDVGPEPVCLYKIGGKVYATHDTCTHGQASMADGFIVDGTQIECPLHQGKFDVCTGQALCAPLTENIKTYAVRIENMRVMLKLD